MAHLPFLIKDLALILGAAALVSLLFKKLKQPVVLGYIIAGFIVGPNFKLFPSIVDVEGVKTWADIGVIFLLFGLGIEFSFKKLIKIGGVSLVTALIEVMLTMLLGFGVGKILGWKPMDCLFLGGILAIASTTIIIRAFDELKVKNQKFAGIVLGVLVIEDLVAVVLMVLLSTVAISNTFEGLEMAFSVMKLAFFLVLWFVSGIFFIPTFLKKLKPILNEESLLVLSLALCFGMVVLASYAGFSPALGAFIMGSILAETRMAEKIDNLIQSVKNLFGAIFFVSVGMLLAPTMILQNWIPIGAATLVLLIGKPLFVTFGALVAGQPLKISVKSGMSLSQIGEFSFIIATLGLTLHVTSDFLYPIAVAVSIITTFTTPYMIGLSDKVNNMLAALLPRKVEKQLTQYSKGAQDIAEMSDWRKIIRFYLINVVVFSVIIIFIIILSTKYLTPVFEDYKPGKWITVSITLIVLAPFLWALAFRRTQRQAYANIWLKASHRGPLIVLLSSRIFLALFYMGFLFDQFFSTKVAAVGVSVTIIILALLSNKIKAFYGRIEKRFLDNFNERQSPNSITTEVLTPWDTHLATFDLDTNSPLIGKPLFELKLRENFGINIAIIERGDFTINIPDRYEHLYPHDKLIVIGTDEHLENFKVYLNSNTEEPAPSGNKPVISLHHFTIKEKCSLINHSILESKIRERSKGLVVGIERNGQRILNPESDFIFNATDTVWLVGNEKRIMLLMKELAE